MSRVNRQGNHAMEGIFRKRFLADLDRINEFGQREDGGVDRVAFGEDDERAREWLRGELRELGLVPVTDGAGNTIARLPGSEPGLAPIACGSHTDTVPKGGRFDGALGVIAGLACLRALTARDAPAPRHPIELINFAAEEATVTAGTFGSRAMAGLVSHGEAEEAGRDPAATVRCRRDPGDLAAYLELHIEQSDELEREGCEIGVVEGIAGLQRGLFEVRGTAAHAGSTPMDRRDDALLKAAAFVQTTHEEARRHNARATIGRLEVPGGAPAIVPEAVRGTLDLRADSDQKLDRLVDALRNPEVEFSAMIRKRAARSDERVLEALENACDDLGATRLRLTSYAGHDARSMSELAPMAMLFVPSRGGVSHSPDEFTTSEQCLRGAEVLLAAIRRIDRLPES